MIKKAINLFWTLRIIRRFSKKNRLIKIFSKLLSECLCVDIGASYFPHSNWKSFILSKKTTWLAIDPNSKNLNYIKSWKYPAKIIAIEEALSKEGGEKNLYISSTDSGSSLLPIDINYLHYDRVEKKNFVPVRERKIKTIGTEEIFVKYFKNQPVLLKLDTQGTELEILDGIKNFKEKKIISIEMECGLDSFPIYQGAAKFGDTQNKLEKLGYELLSMKVINRQFDEDKIDHTAKEIVSHCDAIFVLDRLELKKRTKDELVALLAFYVSNGFFLEAKNMIENFDELKRYLQSSPDYKTIISLLRVKC